MGKLASKTNSISIKTTGGPVMAKVLAETEHLFVHNRYERRKFQKGLYIVSVKHLGYGITGAGWFSSVRDATGFMQHIQTLTDWTKVTPENAATLADVRAGCSAAARKWNMEMAYND